MCSGPVSRTSLMVEEILWLHFSLNMAMPFSALALFAGSQRENITVEAKQISAYQESLLSFSGRGDITGSLQLS